MAAPNTNTDLTEEDAADLQFPKDSNFLVQPNVHKISTNCTHCYQDLSDRFILCAECDICICCACFASGVEFDDHRNDHSYRVLSYDFAVFQTSDWTAKEELILLDGLLTLGNLKSISKKLPNRTVKEIQEHYDYFYLSRKGHSSLPIVKTHENAEFIPPVIPYRLKLEDSEEPPRHSSISQSYHTVAGYNAARSDFELDYDTNAEDLIANLDYVTVDDPNYNVLSELQCAVIRIYNSRLNERRRRHQIIKTHGLILIRKVASWLRRYEATITQPVYDRLIRFMQFYSGERFEYVMEGLHRAGELKIQIARLCDYHKRGITSLAGARLYLNLKQNREDSLLDLKKFYANPIFNFKLRTMSAAVVSMGPTSSKRRSAFTPLDIVGMPGYEKLLSKERELCRNCRLVPLTYLELKSTLIAENNKLGQLKLLTARRLLKIDVNKTRRLYDFLSNEGYIVKG